MMGSEGALYVGGFGCTKVWESSTNREDDALVWGCLYFKSLERNGVERGRSMNQFLDC